MLDSARDRASLLAVKTSLVIPTLNGMPLLEEVLDAVDRQPDAGALERIAIDSGSNDGTVECLRDHGFAVESIPQREFNHGATRDRAIGQTSGDVVVLLTQDATPADDGWLPRLVEVYEDELVGAAYCRQIPRPDCNPFIAQRLREWTAGKTELGIQEPASTAEFDALEPMQRLQRSAYDNVAGSVRRSVWERHRFGHRAFGEDVAFGKRVILGGNRIVFQPASAVIHSHNRSAVAEGKRIYCDHQNLKDLFGVHLVPDRAAYRQNVEWARQQYGEQVLAMDLPKDQKATLHQWALDYAQWAARGMYLGGNADRFSKGLLGLVFRFVDGWMHRGI